MSDTEIRMMRYTIEQLSAEIQATRQYASDIEQKLDRTRKALDVAVNALNKIANTDIKVIEKEPLYYARAMFSVTNNALGRIQDIKQKDVK